MTRQEIMSKAWTLARQGQERFGGKLRQYISSALRIVWKESRIMEVKDRIEELEGMGFKRWQKNGMDRLYINYSSVGIEIDHYNTGNICYCAIDGDRVSNAEGRRIADSKTWIDVNTNTLHSNNFYMFNQVCSMLRIPGSDARSAYSFETKVA